jgi:hypothetical protein
LLLLHVLLLLFLLLPIANLVTKSLAKQGPW